MVQGIEMISVVPFFHLASGGERGNSGHVCFLNVAFLIEQFISLFVASREYNNTKNFY